MLFEWEKCCGNKSNMLPQIMQSGLPLIGRQKQTTHKKETAVRKRTLRCNSTAASRSNSKQHHAAQLTGDAFNVLNSSSQADAPLQFESGDPLLLMQAASFITGDDLLF